MARGESSRGPGPDGNPGPGIWDAGRWRAVSSSSAMAEDEGSRDRKGGALRTARVRGVEVLATVLRVVGTLAAVALVVHVVLTVGKANPDNGITRFFDGLAGALAFGFRDLFTPENPDARVIVNYGLAAVVWLVVTAIVVRVVKALAR